MTNIYIHFCSSDQTELSRFDHLALNFRLCFAATAWRRSAFTPTMTRRCHHHTQNFGFALVLMDVASSSHSCRLTRLSGAVAGSAEFCIATVNALGAMAKTTIDLERCHLATWAARGADRRRRSRDLQAVRQLLSTFL